MPRPTPRQGAATSSKQLAWTVVDGKAVTFYVSGLPDPVSGYVCGMDDFHWMVITANAEKHLIHKSAAALISLSDHSTLDEEPNRDALDEVIGPFRRYVEQTFFGRSSGASASTERDLVS